MTHFRPLWVVTGWGVRVCQRDDVGDVAGCAVVAIGLVIQRNRRLVLDFLGLEVIAEVGFFLGPGDGKGDAGKKVVDYYCLGVSDGCWGGLVSIC